MSKRNQLGAAKIITKAGTVWCHMSVSGDTRKLRRYSEGTTFEINADDEDIIDVVPLKVCMTLVPSKSYSYKEVAVWTKILQKLDAGIAPTSRDVAVRASVPGIIVPITELRRFYDVLKLLDVATFRNLADFYCANPKSLERLWDISRKTFSEYRNMQDWGRGETKTLPQPPSRLSDVSNTNEFTAFVKERAIGDDNMRFTYVEREINPWRTQLGHYSNKLPATKSGTGGMDLLLRSYTNGFPVVGEVKVKKDKNAFYALLQAMTYAVELSTLHQLKRIKKHFPSDFESLKAETANVEIAVIMVNPVDDPTREPVLKLITKMNQRRKCEGLGRVVLLQNAGEDWTAHL